MIARDHVCDPNLASSAIHLVSHLHLSELVSIGSEIGQRSDSIHQVDAIVTAGIEGEGKRGQVAAPATTVTKYILILKHLKEEEHNT